MTDIKQKSRLDWTDDDWATYLGCPVAKISEYNKILNENYLMALEQDTQTKNHAFAMYRYDIAPSGQKRLRLLFSSKNPFTQKQDALTHANNIISTMELNDFYAAALGVPAKAIQMLLIREK